VAWRLRPAGPGDRDLLLSADLFDGPVDPDFLDRFLGFPNAPDPRSILILAESDGMVVGFASGLVQDHPDKPPSLFIIELGVNEAAQRQGIGLALLQAIRDEGRIQGCTSSWVLTEGDNVVARALYRRAGGQETEAITMYDWDESPPGQGLPLRPLPQRG
jgi:ribosomal protein S18 acetylase RimI-like enzyme